MRLRFSLFHEPKRQPAFAADVTLSIQHRSDCREAPLLSLLLERASLAVDRVLLGRRKALHVIASERRCTSLLAGARVGHDLT